MHLVHALSRGQGSLQLLHLLLELRGRGDGQQLQMLLDRSEVIAGNLYSVTNNRHYQTAFVQGHGMALS